MSSTSSWRDPSTNASTFTIAPSGRKPRRATGLRMDAEQRVRNHRIYIFRHLKGLGYFEVATHADREWWDVVRGLVAEGYLEEMIGPRRHESIRTFIPGPELRDAAA